MPYLITNVSIDPVYAMARRTATKLVMTPMIAGRRLNLRSSLKLSDAQFAHNKSYLEGLVRKGVIKITAEKVVSAPVAAPPQESKREVIALGDEAPGEDLSIEMSTSPTPPVPPPVPTEEPRAGVSEVLPPSTPNQAPKTPQPSMPSSQGKAPKQKR